MILETTYDVEKRLWKGDRVEGIFNPNKSIGEVALYMLRSKPADTVCQISDSEQTTLTCGTVSSYAISVAAHLKTTGLDCDDVVGIVSYNTTLLMPVLVGCLINGTPYQPLNPLLDEDGLRNLFTLTKPKVIFCDGLYYEKVRNATKKLNVSIYTLCNHLASGEAQQVQEILQPVEMAEVYKATPLKYGPTQTVVIICSSGTTGSPKAVCVSNSTYITDYGLCNGSSVIFSFATPDWATSILIMVANLLNGGLRIITTHQCLPDKLIQIIKKYKVTLLFGSYFHVGMLSQSPLCTKEAMSSVRMIFISGGHASPTTQSRIRAKLTHGTLINAYGIANNCFDYKSNSVGRLFANVQLKIVDRSSDNQGRLLGPNEVGEIWIKRCDTWRGYYGNEKATAEIMDADGWINTGDVGYMDDERYLYLVDRNKDILKYMDCKYSLSEIEETVALLPDVLDVCVFGVADEYAGDSAAAAVVLKPGSNLKSDDIINFVAAELEVKHKHINYGVFFVNSIARNSNGKVMRSKMKEICLKMEKK